MKKGDVGMAKHFSKKYGNKGWAFNPVSAIWNKFLFCQDACQHAWCYIPTSLPQEQAAKTNMLSVVSIQVSFNIMQLVGGCG